MQEAPRTDEIPQVTLNSNVSAPSGGWDIESLSAFIWENKSYLLATAVKICGDQFLGEEILSQAIVKVLEQVSAKNADIKNPAAFITQTMRNQYINTISSAENKTIKFDPQENAYEDLFSFEDRSFDEVDAERIFAITRKAFQRLPENQQIVLDRIILQDEKPRHLAEELNKTPNSVSLDLRRAKKGLRAKVLEELLSEEGKPTCQVYSSQIPEELDNAKKDGPHPSGIRHLLECENCQKAVGIWRYVMSSFGVLGVLALAEGVFSTPTAAAAATVLTAAGSNGNGAVAGSGSSTAGSASSPVQSGGQSTSQAAGQMAGNVAGASNNLLITAATLGAAGLGVMAFALISPENTPQIELSSSRTNLSSEETPGRLSLEISGLELDLNFTVPEYDWWTIDSFKINIPTGMILQDVPTGWTCTEVANAGYDCKTGIENPVGGKFILANDSTESNAENFNISFVASTENDIKIFGTAYGTLPRK